VLVARTLAQGVDHLLLDEPTNHLDVGHQHQVLDLVRGLGVCVDVVLHDVNLAARYEIVLLDGGRVAARGTPAEICTPGVLEPVYRVRVRPIVDDDVPQLLFSPPHRGGPE
jgi:iron complex transport system ATP-binding protein